MCARSIVYALRRYICVNNVTISAIHYLIDFTNGNASILKTSVERVVGGTHAPPVERIVGATCSSIIDHHRLSQYHRYLYENCACLSLSFVVQDAGHTARCVLRTSELGLLDTVVMQGLFAFTKFHALFGKFFCCGNLSLPL